MTAGPGVTRQVSSLEFLQPCGAGIVMLVVPSRCEHQDLLSEFVGRDWKALPLLVSSPVGEGLFDIRQLDLWLLARAGDFFFDLWLHVLVLLA